MNYDSYKEQVIYTCDDIINNCDRMTSGNYMHNINAIKLMAKIIRDHCLPHLCETPQSPWISVEERLPEKSVLVIVKTGIGNCYLAAKDSVALPKDEFMLPQLC